MKNFGLVGRCVPIAMLLMAGAAHAAVPGSGLQTEAGDTVAQLIVRYKKDPDDAQLAARMSVAKRAGAARGFALAHARRGAHGVHVLKIGKQVSVRDARELAKDLVASDPNIEYAEPDFVMAPDFVPNDGRYNEQWNYQGYPGGIFAPEAWDLATGTNVVVAVVDTGYRPHPDLFPNLLPGYDFISYAAYARDGNGRDANPIDQGDWRTQNQCAQSGVWAERRDSTWHGTHVAGTVAAVTNNGTGVSGVAFNARVVPVRVLGSCGGTVSDIADGIIWASGGSVPGAPINSFPAQVINLSLGAPGTCSTTYQNAINIARSRNSVVVVSAGNDNTSSDANPASCNGVITVAATAKAGGKASYSNYGPKVEIAAPGGDGAGGYILSTWNLGLTTPGSDDYGFMPGTSMAAPHVSGVAALMLSRNPTLTPDQISALIQSSARGFPAACSGCGAGIVNAFNAVNAVPLPIPVITLPESLSVYGSHPTTQAVAMIWLAASGELLITQGTSVTPAGSWITPRVGMSNYEARAVSNTGCAGPGAQWVSLAQGVSWEIGNNGGPGDYSYCSFYLQIRNVSDAGTILTNSFIELSATTDMY